MNIRSFGQWICLLVMACSTGSLVVSCSGGSTGISLFDGGSAGGDASTEAGVGVGVGGDDGTGPATDDGGNSIAVGEGGTSCKPKTCTDFNYNCGPNSDGCGGLLQCGTCPTGEMCGYGGYSVCGSIFTTTGTDGSIAADGGPPICTPKTCADLGYNCGPAGDGCGGLLACGSCTSPQFCGGGGMPSVCGGNNGLTPDGSVACRAKTCADWGFNCGPAGDGCGGSLSCGTCTAPQFCGGGGKPSMCGGNNGHTADGSVACTPKTCGTWGFNCGPAGDGCGGALQCGTCAGTEICGGTRPGVCGTGLSCTGLCTQQVKCDSGQTTLTGTVFAGVSAWTGLTPDPVPNVLVYVPNAPLQAFTAGAACRQCGADVSGSPLVSTYTEFDGTFTLTNVPAGTNIPVVIQLGRWRRQFKFNVPSCASTSIGNLNLPRNQGEGNLPLTAVSTGNVDALECVLMKMGVDQAEFTPDNGPGRIHVYGGGLGSMGGNPGAIAGPGTRDETALLAMGGTFMNYDQIMLPCWGAPATKTATELANLIRYADTGGHFFATHFSYSWLVGNGEFNNVAQWGTYYNPGGVSWTLNVRTIVPPSPPSPHVGTFAKWLNLVQALSNWGPTVPANPQVSISNPRHDANGVTGGSVDWIDGTDPDKNTSMVEHFTFNTPVAATSQCGHAIFSDFHVTNSGGSNGQTFPAECDTAFAPQEKILEYMIWDLSSCVPPPPAPSCRPLSCSQQSIGCGPAGDGCGNPLNCGPCAPPLTCGGGGVPGQCGAPDGGSCQPVSCTQQNIACGPAGDGCGNAVDCGPCTPPLTCGGGGVPGQCGAPDGGSCQPLTCPQQNISCGPAGDGCGGALDCGACTPPLTCGGGGVPGQCGAVEAGSCTPRTCQSQNVNCGPAGDGCGNLLLCGMCAAPQTCGGGGIPGQCGGIQ
jgi:hypothetical protein